MMTVLLVDDDPGFSRPVSEYLEKNGCHVITASTVEEGIAGVRFNPVSIVLLDLNLKGESGLTLLQFISEKAPEIPVAVLTGYASLDTSIEALRLRAVDYLLKPVPLDELLARIQSMTGIVEAEDESDEQLRVQSGIIGASGKIAEAMSQIRLAAKSSHNVLITGESGTGKELVAKAIHENGDRRNKPFVTVNCAALGETLFHGEMFGYRKGSYTGAVASHNGYLKVADSGSLFLDEIGEIPLTSQAKLLRVLETGEFNPIGETQALKINVRFIAATNRDIKKEVDQGNFRLDLYYRLNVFHIQLPSLRERLEDVPLLAEHFLKKHKEASGSRARGFSQRALDVMSAYLWPGNVRQLEGVVVRALAHCSGNLITEDHLPRLENTQDQAPPSAVEPISKAKRLKVREAEMDCLMAALREANGNITIAAEILGINRATIYRKIAKYNIDIDKFRSAQA